MTDPGQYDGPKGAERQKWEEPLIEAIIKNQKTLKDGCANGSWDTLGEGADKGGRVYVTTLNSLSLEVYYRLRIVLKK